MTDQRTLFAREPMGLRRWLVIVPAFAAFLLWPLWYRFPAQPDFIAPFYFLRFAFTAPVMLAILAWVAGGFTGYRDFVQDGWRSVFVALLLGLALWAYLSTSWAFRRDVDPQLALGASIQVGVAVLFALAIASVRMPPYWIALAMLVGAAWHVVLVGQQAALQESVGGVWSMLGEFPIGVGVPRISVVQAEGVRLLRPYGLLPHPNVLAGFLAAALISGLPVLIAKRLPLLVALPVAGAILWVFLLTFSRGAYLALGAAALLSLVLLARNPAIERHRLGAFAGFALVVGVAFFAVYQPFLLARAGVGAETTEQYSAAERVELNAAAVAAWSERPLTGVGAGNLPWRSAFLLAERGSIVQGNYPHNIILSVAGEYGLIGAALLVGAVTTALFGALRGPKRTYRAGLIAAFAALLIAGQFDYYLVTFIQFQAGSWALIAAALADRN